MSRLQTLLSTLSARPLQCDGATGTQLQSLGLQAGECCERWVLDHPDRVRLVHQRYLDAGADLLTTNTFGGAAFSLAAHGLDARAAEINRAAALLAREVAGERAWVLGDIGPFGGILEPYGETEPATATAAFRAQAAALLEGGADAILVETMSDPVESALAIAAARKAGAQFVLATFAFQNTPSGFRTMMGATPAAAVQAALDAGANVVGANCGTQLTLDDYASLTAELLAAANAKPVGASLATPSGAPAASPAKQGVASDAPTNAITTNVTAANAAPVIVQPNAGSPVQDLITGAIRYNVTPEAFATAAARYITLGARIVGGCCGTTPAHIAASARMNKK